MLEPFTCSLSVKAYSFSCCCDFESVGRVWEGSEVEPWELSRRHYVLRQSDNGFVCRFEPDMLAFSGCYYGGGDKERRELAAIRRRWKTLHVMPTCVCVRGGMMIGLLKQGSYAKEKFCSLCIWLDYFDALYLYKVCKHQHFKHRFWEPLIKKFYFSNYYRLFY